MLWVWYEVGGLGALCRSCVVGVVLDVVLWGVGKVVGFGVLLKLCGLGDC